MRPRLIDGDVATAFAEHVLASWPTGRLLAELLAAGNREPVLHLPAGGLMVVGEVAVGATCSSSEGARAGTPSRCGAPRPAARSRW